VTVHGPSQYLAHTVHNHFIPFNFRHRLFAPSPVHPTFTGFPPTHNFTPLNSPSHQPSTRCPTSCTYHADLNRILYTRVRQLPASYIYHSSSHLRALLYNAITLSFSLTSACAGPRAGFPGQTFRSSATQRLEYSTADATSIIKSIDRALRQLSSYLFCPNSGTAYCLRPVGDGVFCFRNVRI
jgi:hypothetical protein